MDDYDVLDLTQCIGKLYLGTYRTASYSWEPGKTTIHLESRTEFYDGICNQLDKGQMICEIWVREGRAVESGGFKAIPHPLVRG